MKPLNNTYTTLLLLSLLASPSVHATGIPVFDATTAANFLATLENDATKITALQSQVQSLQKQIDMNTGTRSMGGTAISTEAAQWGGVLQQVMNSTGSYGTLITQIIADRTLMTAAQKGQLTTEQRDILARLWHLGAVQKVMADLTTTTATRQMTEIQALTDRIDTAEDPKAIADLNAALNAKKLELDNTKLQLYAMDQQIQAEQKLIEQRRQELEINRAGTTSSIAVHIR